MNRKNLKYVVCVLLLGVYTLFSNAQITHAQRIPCTFYPVSTPLNDLGSNEYFRLNSTNPLTYQATGYIGGLYPGGTNIRPPLHELAGVNIARNQVQPLNSTGNPDPIGKIGFVSIGMSNTRQEFDTFMRLFDQSNDPYYSLVNPNLVVVDGAQGGGVLEKWSDPNNPDYGYYWGQVDTRLRLVGLSYDQVQILWIKVTEYDYLPTFPENALQYQSRLENLVRIAKGR